MEKTIKLLLGDCIEVLKTIPDNSIDSIVTDPPYGLEFMGKEWDTFKEGRIAKYKEGGKVDLELMESRKGKGGAGPSYTKRAAAKCRNCGKQRWSGSPCKCEEPDFEIDNSTQHTFQSFTEAWARECYRVLKPGGHFLAFGGSRMYHRLACGVEDAGFEIRDQIMWVYGSGFPKSLNIGKTMDKFVKTGNASWNGTGDSSNGALGFTKLQHKQGYRPDDYSNRHQNKDEITEDVAQEWEGWGTALKPAHEPIVMARKPLSEKSIVENVLKHGTGGINIDGSRIGYVSDYDKKHQEDIRKGTGTFFGGEGESKCEQVDMEGRFPANIIFDEEAGQLLDEQSGKLNKQGKCKTDNKSGWQDEYVGGKKVKAVERKLYLDTGGASRFFYCPKTSKKDRNEGLLVEKEKNKRPIGVAFNNEDDLFKQTTGNNHPTVKPTDLMRYLVNLVTPKGGTVLDPFMGSGSTGKAAVRAGFNFIGIEKEQEYMDIAEARINHEKNKPVQGELY